MTKLERGIPSAAQAEAMRDIRVTEALWHEIHFRNQQRIKDAMSAGMSSEKATQQYPTIALEDMLKKAQQEAA